MYYSTYLKIIIATIFVYLHTTVEESDGRLIYNNLGKDLSLSIY